MDQQGEESKQTKNRKKWWTNFSKKGNMSNQWTYQKTVNLGSQEYTNHKPFYVHARTHTKQCGNCRSGWEYRALATGLGLGLGLGLGSSLTMGGSTCIAMVERHCLENLKAWVPYIYQGYTLEKLLHMWQETCTKKFCSIIQNQKKTN